MIEYRTAGAKARKKAEELVYLNEHTDALYVNQPSKAYEEAVRKGKLPEVAGGTVYENTLFVNIALLGIKQRKTVLKRLGLWTEEEENIYRETNKKRVANMRQVKDRHLEQEMQKKIDPKNTGLTS